MFKASQRNKSCTSNSRCCISVCFLVLCPTCAARRALSVLGEERELGLQQKPHKPVAQISESLRRNSLNWSPPRIARQVCQGFDSSTSLLAHMTNLCPSKALSVPAQCQGTPEHCSAQSAHSAPVLGAA